MRSVWVFSLALAGTGVQCLIVGPGQGTRRMSPCSPSSPTRRSPPAPLQMSLIPPPDQKEKTEAGKEGDGPMLTNVAGPVSGGTSDEVEGLPWWWEYFWKLPFTKRGEAGEPLTLGDTMHVFRTNIEQIYGDFPSVDGTPLAEGDLGGLTDGTMYLGLYEYMKVGACVRVFAWAWALPFQS